MNHEEAIRRLFTEYCYYMDDRDDRVIDLFTEDCLLTSTRHGGEGRRGRSAIHDMLERLRATREPDDVRHVVSNLLIDADNTTAKTMAYVQRFRRGSEGPYLWSIGTWEDELRLEDRWRISVHCIVPAPTWEGPLQAT
jgi:hypothetical protein